MRDKACLWLFTLALAFYPRRLREQFGDEMQFVFEEQVRDARRAAGFAGAVRVWICTTKEAWTVGLPQRLAPVVVPALAIATAAVWFIGVLGLIPLARAK